MHPSIRTALLTIITVPALLAHPGHEGGLTAGLMHPLSGLDHLLAMVAVGLLAVRCGGHGRWMVPASFLTAMLVGGLISLTGITLPLVETGIAISVLVFGTCIALATPPRIWIACVAVAAFAILHGYAHIAEAGEAGTAGYACGFLVSTAALHGAGVALGMLAMRNAPVAVLRVTGSAIAACGLLLAIGVL